MPIPHQSLPNLGATPTASDVIAKHVRDAIISGSLHEGEPVRQEEVARLFRVSKIPVREALKRLEAEGLVVFQRNKGAIVTSTSDSELVQIFEVRATLEADIIRRSVPAMTEATFREAAAICDAFAAESDVARYAELNWQFHAALYRDANRPYLFNLIRSVNDRIERFLRMQLALSSGLRTADREHRAILAACRARDADRAASLLEAHIMGVCASLLAHLPGPAAGVAAVAEGGD